MTVAYGLWALDLANVPQNATTEAMVEFLLKTQRQDGSWRRSSQRPPLEDSDITCTVLSVHYMMKYASDAQLPKVESASERAAAWLLQQKPKSQEDWNSLLGGLGLFRAGAERISQARDAVLAAQREDGGWGQVDGMASDAYATGQALFTLQRIGLPTTHAAYRRGIDYLLATQRADGSWYVKSRAKPIQKLFDNGDPHGTDQFISTPATCWATTALLLSLPPTTSRRL